MKNFTIDVFSFCLSVLFLLSGNLVVSAGEYYISPTGNDTSGNGTIARPWKTLSHAVKAVPDDGSKLILRDGLYRGTTAFSRAFKNSLEIVAENPYLAKLSSPENSNRVLYITKAANVVFNGLEFFGSGSEKTDYLIQITTKESRDVAFRNCIIHDSYKNDLIKINDSASRIVFSGCIFYNQPPNGGDEHFDINTVTDITVEDSIFFNDYPGSGRPAANAGHSFIVIKNSGKTPNVTKNITFRRNIFMNWCGKKDNAFILLGEDGKPFFEAQNILIENNLFLHHGNNPIWGALLYKGGLKNVVTRANTITGHPKTEWTGAFSVMVLNIGENPKIERMSFANNIFCDNTGRMPQFSYSKSDRFATPQDFSAANNLYWNAGKKLKLEPADLFSPDRDPKAVLGDPVLPSVPDEQIIPRLSAGTNRFLSGKSSIREEFERLVEAYAVPGNGSAAIGKADPKTMPKDDILGRPRGRICDIGCYETAKGNSK